MFLTRHDIHPTILFSLKTPRPVSALCTESPIVTLLNPLLERVLGIQISHLLTELAGAVF
jgi:hypothetical protein